MRPSRSSSGRCQAPGAAPGTRSRTRASPPRSGSTTRPSAPRRGSARARSPPPVPGPSTKRASGVVIQMRPARSIKTPRTSGTAAPGSPTLTIGSPAAARKRPRDEPIQIAPSGASRTERTTAFPEAAAARPSGIASAFPIRYNSPPLPKNTSPPRATETKSTLFPCGGAAAGRNTGRPAGVAGSRRTRPPVVATQIAPSGVSARAVTRGFGSPSSLA